MMTSPLLTRRTLLQAVAAQSIAVQSKQFTDFQIACMTWSYVAFPFERALKGIASAGYRYVAWGPWHKNEAGENVPVLSIDAPVSRAKELSSRCVDLGLEPVMMFGVTYLEDRDAQKIYQQKIAQAQAARIPYILCFGNPKTAPDARAAWIKNLAALGPVARDAGVTLTIKQHGGPSATGRNSAEIVHEVNDDGVRMFYDAGNTLWYGNTDPLTDIPLCAQYIRGFAIKDSRGYPRRVDCGPGFGEVDHFKLLLPVARTGMKMPLACETLFEPFVPRPTTPAAVDALARRAREFLETITSGIRAALAV
jgi:sugar phosphate isomerase/epimerase